MAHALELKIFCTFFVPHLFTGIETSSQFSQIRHSFFSFWGLMVAAPSAYRRGAGVPRGARVTLVRMLSPPPAMESCKDGRELRKHSEKARRGDRRGPGQQGQVAVRRFDSPWMCVEERPRSNLHSRREAPKSSINYLWKS